MLLQEQPRTGLGYTVEEEEEEYEEETRQDIYPQRRPSSAHRTTRHAHTRRHKTTLTTPLTTEISL